MKNNQRVDFSQHLRCFRFKRQQGGTAQEPWPLICWPSSSCQGERWNLSAPVDDVDIALMIWCDPQFQLLDLPYDWYIFEWNPPSIYIYIYLDVYVTYWAMLIAVLAKSVFVLLYPMLAATRYVHDFPFLYMDSLTLKKWWTYTRNRFSSPIDGSIEAWYWLYIYICICIPLCNPCHVCRLIYIALTVVTSIINNPIH